MRENKKIVVGVDTSDINKAKQDATRLLRELTTEQQRADNTTLRDSRARAEQQKSYIDRQRQELTMLREKIALQEKSAQIEARRDYLEGIRTSSDRSQIRAVQEKYEQSLVGIGQTYSQRQRQVDALLSRYGGAGGANVVGGSPMGAMTGAQLGMYGQMIGQPFRQGLSAVGGATSGYDLYAQAENIKKQSLSSVVGSASTAIGSGLMMTGNPMAMAVGGVVSVVGNIFSQIYSGLSEAETQLMSRAFQASSQYSQSSRGLARLMGGGIGRAKGVGFANQGFYASLGLNMTEGVQQQSQYYGAFLDPRQALSGSRDLMMLEAQYGINASQLQRSMSEAGSGTTANSLLQGVYGSLVRQYGKEGARLRLAGMTDTAYNLGQSLYNRTGQSGAFDSASQLLTSLSASTGFSGGRLAGLAQELTQTGGDPLSKMTSIEVARRLRPDWTARELSNAGELLAGDTEYIRGVGQMLQEQSGGNLALFQARLGSQFGLSAKNEQYISRELQKGKTWDELINTPQVKAMFDKESMVDDVTRSKIQTENELISAGEKLVPQIQKDVEKMAGYLESILNKMTDQTPTVFNSAMSSYVTEQGSIFDKMKNTDSAWLIMPWLNPTTMK